MLYAVLENYKFVMFTSEYSLFSTSEINVKFQILLKWPPKQWREQRERTEKCYFDFVCHFCFVSWWKIDQLNVKKMSLYDITWILRTTCKCRPFVYWVSSKPLWILRTTRVGLSPLNIHVKFGNKLLTATKVFIF